MALYSLDAVIARLRKHPGIVIQGKGVAVTAGMVGIKTYGMIDYLVNAHHYHLTITKKESK